jgi:hypothetical protein
MVEFIQVLKKFHNHLRLKAKQVKILGSDGFLTDASAVTT